MSNYNVIFDGNFIFFKNLFTSKKDTPKSRKFFDRQEDKKSFFHTLATDIEFTLNKFPDVNKVIFTKDKNSWRKSIDLNEDGFDSYKSHRVLNESINWTEANKAMDEFLDYLKTQGIIISIIDGAEGDDLMYLWSDYFNNNNESSIIVTADGDMKQILKYNENNTFTIQYNNKQISNVFYSPLGFYKWLENIESSDDGIDESNDIFNMSHMTNKKSPIDVLKSAFKKSKYNEEDPMYVLFSKIFMGDKKDNIPSLAYWNSKTGNRRWRISEKPTVEAYTRLLEKYGEINIDSLRFDGSYRLEVKKLFEDLCKRTFKSDFLDKLDRNIDLLYLDKDILPDDLISNFNKHSNDVNDIKFHRFDKFNMFKDTDYDIKKIGTIESSVFNL